jgi:dihydrodipicolinate synthase/N-acetylneuraminate lyase
MGCQAHLVGVASFLPKVAFSFHKAYQNGDMKTAWGIINELERPFFEIGMKYGWHPVLKSGMNALGIMSRAERPPLCSLSEAQHAEVEDVINQMRKSQHWKE